MARLLSLYCDGSSHDRSGLPGGWAFIVVSGGEEVLRASGAQRSTTNNVMELTAALEGLRAIVARGWHHRGPVELVSDSRVTLEVAAGTWMPKRADPLAAQVRSACLEAHALTRWIRGHSGDVWNEQVDALAGEARQTLVPARVKLKAARRAALRKVPR